MEKLLTGLECLASFDLATQQKIIVNLRNYAGADLAIEWLLDEDYSCPKEFLGTTFPHNSSLEGVEFWEELYNSL